MLRKILISTITLFFIISTIPMYGSAEMRTETFNDSLVEISGPDEALENQDFNIEVKGTIMGGSTWKVHLYLFYENADWYYDSDHRVVVKSYGRIMDQTGYKWGSGIMKTYTLNKEPGIYKYTFVFYDMSSVHTYYAVAVDLDINVKNKIVTPEDIDEFIQALSDSAFKNNNTNLKKAFHNKLKALSHMIEVGDFESAIGKTPHDIKNKFDSWITDPVAREELHKMMDSLYQWLLNQFQN